MKNRTYEIPKNNFPRIFSRPKYSFKDPNWFRRSKFSGEFALNVLKSNKVILQEFKALCVCVLNAFLKFIFILLHIKQA